MTRRIFIIINTAISAASQRDGFLLVTLIQFSSFKCLNTGTFVFLQKIKINKTLKPRFMSTIAHSKYTVYISNDHKTVLKVEH